jgi:16S rRNA processing protein RimM
MTEREGGERLCLGVITGTHGVRGQVRVKSFTEKPEDIAAYGVLMDERGRGFRLTLTGASKGVLLARVEGVEDRDAAAALKGTRLYVERDVLPEIGEPETWYRADLVGLAAEDVAGRPLGRVAEVHNFGAGDLLEVTDEGGRSGLYPFTRQVVPVVDVAGGRIVIEPPEELEAKPPEGGGKANEEGGSDTGQTGSETS